MIELRSASLRHGSIIGLSPTSFRLPDGGGITGLLGPNGAGKSSLIQLLSGLLPPSGGDVKVFGEPPFRNRAVLTRIGLVPEGDRLPSGLRADGWLKMMGSLSGLHGEKLRAGVLRALTIAGMEERARLYFTAMSKGMRQRMRLAQALLHDPDLLILDEPFNGLDSEARLRLMELLGGLAKEGRRVIVSSHILGDVAQLTDRILLLFRGRLLAEGSVSEIRQLLDRHPVELRLSSDLPDAVRIMARWAVEQPELVSLRMEEGSVVMSVTSPHQLLPRLQTAVANRLVPLQSLTPLDLNLDAVFQYLVKEHS